MFCIRRKAKEQKQKENEEYATARVKQRKSELLSSYCSIAGMTYCTDKCAHFKEGYLFYYTNGEVDAYGPYCRLWGITQIDIGEIMKMGVTVK